MIRVQEEAFDPGAELNAFAAGRRNTGAIASFTGLVRAGDSDEPLVAMTLEHYPGMTERQLEAIEAEAVARFDLQDSLVIHRHGRLLPGEPIVLVLTAATHRQAAFDACNFLMDWLKTKAPFWKHEETAEGGRWVDARETDDKAAARWNR